MPIGGPMVLPACCETAIDALDRAYQIHLANAHTPWLNADTKASALLKAHRCEQGIEWVYRQMKELKHLPPK